MTDGFCKQDELKFMRIRTKRHELIITPGTCNDQLGVNADF